MTRERDLSRRAFYLKFIYELKNNQNNTIVVTIKNIFTFIIQQAQHKIFIMNRALNFIASQTKILMIFRYMKK